jgi:predicted O-methyltransferase YrrM
MNLESLAFCPVLQEMLRTKSTRGKSNKKFEELDALSSLNNLVTLRNLCLSIKPERTLEIGLCFGGSALIFTSSHRDLRHRPERQHVAVDPFQMTVWDEAGLLAVEKAGLAGFLDVRPTFSHLELPALLSQKTAFDLVYIDGSHLFEDVFVDFYYIARLLNSHGVVVFDDCADPNVAKVLGFAANNLSLSLEELDLSRHRLDGGRPWRYRIAKFLAKNQLRAFRKTGNASRNWDAPFADF